MCIFGRHWSQPFLFVYYYGQYCTLAANGGLSLNAVTQFFSLANSTIDPRRQVNSLWLFTHWHLMWFLFTDTWKAISLEATYLWAHAVPTYTNWRLFCRITMMSAHKLLTSSVAAVVCRLVPWCWKLFVYIYVYIDTSWVDILLRCNSERLRWY